MRSWCDKLASTPAVGYRFANQYEPANSILEAFSPLFVKWMRGDTQTFKIVSQEPFGVQFTTDDGFHYGVDHTRVWVEFRHSMKAKLVSGGPPVLEMMSRAMPYTQLLPVVSKRVIDAVALLPSTKTKTLTQVGVIARTAVDEDDLPPGIARFIKYVGRPWKGLVNQYNLQIVSQIGEGKGWSDRCIHTLTKTEDPEQLLTVNFDWQRSFKDGRSITQESLKQVTEEAEKVSTKYFEDLAEGNRFDEEILLSAARA